MQIIANLGCSNCSNIYFSITSVLLQKIFIRILRICYLQQNSHIENNNHETISMNKYKPIKLTFKNKENILTPPSSNRRNTQALEKVMYTLGQPDCN